MRIRYIRPLESAFSHMGQALFKPFNLAKWFVVGFTAFLAGLLDGCGGNGPYQFNKSDFDYIDPAEIINFPRTALDWLLENPGWFIFILFIIVIVISIIMVVLWLSSRGKFMFLDNVVQNQSQVVVPWKQFKKQGNSLFMWRLGFGLVSFAVFLFFTILFLGILYKQYEYSYTIEDISILFIVGVVFTFLLLFIITAYISLFLDHFIVPIMYKNDIFAMRAWSKFLPLLGRYFIQFILYGLFNFVLMIAVFIGFILIGIFTCCIGFLLLIIPYINSVFTLPISYTFRAFSLEFLAQFGEEYTLFPPRESETPVQV